MKAIKAVNSLPTKPPRAMCGGSDARTGLRHCGHQYSGRVCCSMVNGGFSTSTCCTMRARSALRCTGPPQQGQTSRGCSSKWVICSAGKGCRSCLVCPGWPPMERLAPSSRAGLGLTMSEDGGLEEVEESLRAAARTSRRRASSEETESSLACSALTCTCSRWQFAQGLLAAVSIAAVLWLLPTIGSVGNEKCRAYAVNGYAPSYVSEEKKAFRFALLDGDGPGHGSDGGDPVGKFGGEAVAHHAAVAHAAGVHPLLIDLDHAAQVIE